MKKSAVLLAVAGMAGVAAAQPTFATYFMTAENLTDPGRGTNNALPGDMFQVFLHVEHDGHSYAGGKVEMLYTGVNEGDIIITEPVGGLLGIEPPNDPGWLAGGRWGLFRIVASDGPSDAIDPHNENVIASDAFGGKVTDVNDDFFDFASTPPGLGGLSGPFPLPSGRAIFNFFYVYDGGVDTWDAVSNGTARIWRDASDINGEVVPADSGATLVISPAPASLALLGLGGLVAGRRRR